MFCHDIGDVLGFYLKKLYPDWGFLSLPSPTDFSKNAKGLCKCHDGTSFCKCRGMAADALNGTCFAIDLIILFFMLMA